MDSLMSRPQVVKIGGHTSSTMTLCAGAPQGCVLGPLLCALFAPGCAARYDSYILFKFAEDTTALGLIVDSDESAYREEGRGPATVAQC